MLLATPTVGYTGCYAPVRDMNLSAAASRISVPTLVVAGMFDAATPSSHTNGVLKQTIDGRLTMLSAAHLSNLEQPEAFSVAIG